MQKYLLICGVLASVLYVAMNAIAAILYPGYSSITQTVSELSAIGSPTRPLWVTLAVIYSSLMIVFGFGVWKSALGKKSLRIVGILFIADAFIGFFWPPMHQREVLAAAGSTISDTFHIVFTLVTVPLMMLAIGFGASALGKGFGAYSILTLVILVVAGTLTGLESPNITTNQPTPWIGVWERINIGVYMLWVAVLAILLIRRTEK